MAVKSSDSSVESQSQSTQSMHLVTDVLMFFQSFSVTFLHLFTPPGNVVLEWHKHEGYKVLTRHRYSAWYLSSTALYSSDKVDLVTGPVSFKEVPIKDARYAHIFDILNIRMLQI